MSKKFKISVIIPIYNVEEYLSETLDSVINQSIGFKDNIEMILINDGSPDNSEEICLKYKEKYPNNIIYYKQKNAGVSAARNKGIELAHGELVTFLDSDDKWSENSFANIIKNADAQSDINIFSCKMCFFDAKKGNHPLNYKYKEDKVIDILDEYEYPQLSSSSIFIRRKIIKDHRYDSKIKYSEDNKFINSIIIENTKIMMLKTPIYYYRKRADESSAIQNQTTNKSWYLVTPEKVYQYLFDLSKEKFGKVIEYIQYLVLYELNWRIVYNNKVNLTAKERSEYSNTLINLINNINQELIINNKHLNLAKKLFLLKIKNDKDNFDIIKFNDDSITIGKEEIKKKTLGFVLLDRIYTKKNKFEVYGKIDRKMLPEETFKIKNKDKEIKVNFYELANDFNEETFNKDYLYDYIGFNFKIDLNEDWSIKFYRNEEWLIPRFKRYSIFTEYLPRSYHHENKRTIMFKKNTIYNHKRNVFKSFYYEFLNDLALLKNKRFKVLMARVDTKIMRLFKRKELWLIGDRVNKADDNGEHFFKYMVDNHPEKQCYFILTKDSPDYERLCNIGPVLDPNSYKYKMIFHRADYVVSSQAENYVFNPLGNSGKFIQDQYNFKYVFLQHGITKDDLSPWLNVNTKRIDMFVTATNPEYESIGKYKYYYDKDVTKLTGFPRFDALLRKKEIYKPQNKIMLSLTWRNSLASKISKETGERIYNPEFKESNYFKFLNRLMTDERLQKVLKEKNYKIRFIPHPNVLCQLEDFPKNEFVEIEEGSINYQKEFCTNKLLVTDYSSVYFDFAYLKKPVIYYQEDRKEFFEGQLYNQGYFDYEKDGFGPVYENYESFVKELIKMIKNDCKLDKKYEDRIDKTFKYQDNKNCERVYEAIMELNK